MSKTKSIVISVILALVVVAVSVLTFASFDLKGAKRYTPIFGLIEVGSDISGSVLAEYNLLEEEGQVSRGDLEENVETIRKRFNLNEFSTASVKTTSKGFIVEVPQSENYSTALTYLTGQGKITFETNAKNDWLTEEDISGASVEEAYSQDGIIVEQSGYAVTIKFNSSGREKFKLATESALNANTSISIKMDGNTLSNAQITEVIDSSSVQITGNYTKAQAEIIASAINHGTLDYAFELNGEVKLVDSILGEKAGMWIILGLLSMLVLVAVLFVVFYKGFGVIADIVLVLATLLFSLIYSVIPVSLITIPSIIGMILAFAVLCGAMVYIFEKIKFEFTQGKTVNSAITNGYKKSYMLAIDLAVLALISFLGGYFIVGAYLKTFVLSFAVATGVAAVSSWLLTRGMVALFKGMVKQDRFYGLIREEETVNE